MDVFLFLLSPAIHANCFMLYLSSSHAAYFLTLRIYGIIWTHLNDAHRR